MPATEIGTITLLQIQTSRLKLGEKPNRTYDPSPIRAVECLLVTADGVYGLTGDGQQIVDVHNKHHHDTRHKPGRGLSLGFSYHYHEIRTKYDHDLSDGVAGENIIVDSSRHYTLDDLGQQLMILDPETEEAIHLNILQGIAPCVPFGEYCLQRSFMSPNEEKATLQFLHDGQRGYLIEALNNSPSGFVLKTGFKLFTL